MERGGYGEEATPVPISNTAVKLLRADGTASRGRVGRRLFPLFTTKYPHSSLYLFIIPPFIFLLLFISTSSFTSIQYHSISIYNTTPFSKVIFHIYYLTLSLLILRQIIFADYIEP